MNTIRETDRLQMASTSNTPSAPEHPSSSRSRVVCFADTIEVFHPEAENRRGHMRLQASDVRWLRSARLKYGPDVHIANISVGGILIETERELTRGAAIVFELSGTMGAVLVPARVLRSRRVASGDIRWYGTACAFMRPLAINVRPAPST